MDYSVALEGVNLLGVLVAVAASVVVGFIWYAEPVFGKDWQKAAGLSKKDLEKANMVTSMGGMVIATLIATVFLAIILQIAGITDVVDGALFGGLLGAFIVGPSYATNYLFEQRSMTLLATNVGYNVVSLIIAGAILVAWQ